MPKIVLSEEKQSTINDLLLKIQIYDLDKVQKIIEILNNSIEKDPPKEDE